MYHCRSSKYRWGLASLFLGLLTILAPVAQATVDIANQPLFVGGGGKPLSLLVMGRDHKLYYEAYNDASDLNQDGEIDVGYKPSLQQDGKPLNYFGYFDSYKCYSNAGLPGVTVFTPVSVTLTKKCSNSWSGDFLNYLTTSRIDALRRVLYGGYRVSDTTSETILERARIPQDAHSWGKEYESIARDGYDIREYAPLDLPTTGTRHLFANVTLKNDSDQKSLLRVLTNSNYRIWNWVAIERPVAGDKCINQSTDCLSAGGTNSTHPSNATEFAALLATFATPSHLIGTGSAEKIDCGSSCNPYGSDDNYITVFKGTLNIREDKGGDYQFSLDGDDATEVYIDGALVFGRYSYNACEAKADNCKATKNLTSGDHTIEYHHEEVGGGDSYRLYWKGPGSKDKDWAIVPESRFSNLVISTYDRLISSGSVRTDYQVRVKACVSGLLESECKGYPEGSPTVYKPTGLLHEYGETDRMAFGLLTGSFKNNLSGGVLRKNVGSFTDEVNKDTGQFIVPATTGSIVDAISKMRIVGFRGNYSYNDNGCGVPMVTAMQEGRCAMWGNPVAEMMYEGLRYFAGKTSATSAYDFTDEFSRFANEDKLNLPKPAWVDPYRTTTGGYPYCSKPFQIVIADAPSFDSDQLPGVSQLPAASSFGSGLTSDIGSLNVTTLGDTIWTGELGGSKNIFIGQSNSNDPAYDTAPTPKTVTSFGNIRGLAPEEPTREGSYYAASVAHFGKATGVRTIVPSAGVSHVVKTDTFGISLSSPLPTIAIPVPSYTDANKKIITVVPFAKSVGGSSISATKGNFQPTNTIVDFFIEAIANTGAGNSGSNCPSTVPVDSAGQACNGGRPYIKFAINYEDSEYGSDHDMDAISTYTMSVNTSNQVEIKLSSDYAAGGVVQHMGYVISGTTKDGVYLEVRDSDTGSGSDTDYFLDTPPEFTGTPPAPDTGTGTWDDNVALPPSGLTVTRTFSPATADTVGAAFIPHDPLWYAAKWGGFIDTDGDNKPNLKPEWDKNNDGKPDTYFLVTNAGKLKEQLSSTFNEIIKRTSSAAAVAVNSSSLIAGGRIYQARFESGDWTGELRALEVDPISGAPGTEVWDASTQLNLQNFNTGRQIITYKPGGDGIPFRWTLTGTTALHSDQIAALNGSDSQGEDRLNWLRGSDADEEPAGNLYRSRTISATRNVLGDIVNSNPFYVGRPDAGYTFSGYSAFATTYKNRRPMVYIGANDGMLHGFDAKTGKEVFAYVPNAIFSKLNALTEQTYIKGGGHQYYVDGSPTVIDVNVGGDWRTVLVSGLRAGGNSYFALDVTDPGTLDPITGDLTSTGSLTEANASSVVMWEFTDPDLGLTFSQPSVVKLSDGTWVTVFGNGYNSSTNKSVLFIIDVATGGGGTKVKIDLGEGQGLSTPSVVDGDGNGVADFIYAGDLDGNLWRFDIRNTDSTKWTVTKLFTAKDPAGDLQPITAAPQVTRHPLVNPSTVDNTRIDEFTYMVLFGTGRYLGNADITDASPQTQSAYGIWDNLKSDTCKIVGEASCISDLAQDDCSGGDAKCFNRDDDLQEQIFCPGDPVDSTCQVDETDSAGKFTTLDGKSYRVTSKRPVNYLGDEATTPKTEPKRGWYLDLTLNAGERVVSDALILGSRFIFTSILPDPDPCEAGGKSWLNILDATTGKRISKTFLGPEDKPVTEPSTGLTPTSIEIGGIASAPNVMKSPEQGKSVLYVTTSDPTNPENLVPVPIADDEIGRQSWRQLEFFQ